MQRILLSGYYGFNNLGDEAILEAIVKNLNKKIEDVEITVLSANPSKTESKYKVKSVNRKNIFKILMAIKNSDLLVSGGGSLLQDITSKRSIHYYFGIIGLGLFMKRKIMVYSHGIGPISKPLNRSITKFLLNRVDFITVRDNESKLDLIDMGVEEKKIEVTADPVISIEKVDKQLGMDIINQYGGLKEGRPTVGFAFRGKCYTNEDIEKVGEIIEEISKDMDANIVFIPFHYNEDLNFMNDVKRNSKEYAVFVDRRHDIKEILSIIENLDLLVGVRLHSLIFSAVAGVPMIGISYDPKIDYFMETIELESLCNINELDKNRLIIAIKEVYNNRAEYSSKIIAKVEELKKKIEFNEDKVKQLLQSGGKNEKYN